jgi:drug/metabolite transporter (DMT)-like permease
MRLRFDGRKAGLALVITADTLWGTVFVVSQVGLRYTDPYNLAFLRFFVAAVLACALVIPFDRKLGITRELRRGMTWAFGLLYTMGFMLQYVGQAWTSAPDATLLSNLSPIMIPPFAFFILKDRITKFNTIAMVLGLGGLVLVTSPSIGTGSLEVMGDLVLLLTSVCYALFTIFTKKYNVSSAGSSFAIIIVTTLFSFPIAVTLGGLIPSIESIGAVGWEAVLYLGVACTLIAITLYLRGLKMIRASEAAFLFLVQVLVGLVLSGILLGEFLSPVQTAGAIAIIVALVFGLSAKR